MRSASVKDAEVISSEAPLRGVRLPPLRFLIPSAIIVVAAGFLIWSATRAAAVYYLTLDEVVVQGQAISGKSIRVQGTVKDGSIERAEGATGIKFTLTDNVREIPVVYERTPPDLLGYSTEQRYQDVVVEGTVDETGVLRARNLLVKHGPEFEPVESLEQQ